MCIAGYSIKFGFKREIRKAGEEEDWKKKTRDTGGGVEKRTYFECRFMMHFHFDMGYSESTFSKYAFGRGGGGHKKSTLCTLVKMVTIMDDP